MAIYKAWWICPWDHRGQFHSVVQVGDSNPGLLHSNSQLCPLRHAASVVPPALWRAINFPTQSFLVVWIALQLKLIFVYFKCFSHFFGKVAIALRSKFMNRNCNSKAYTFCCLEMVQRLNQMLVCQTKANIHRTLQIRSKIHQRTKQEM